MNHLVSIITPTYNHERYIADCISSVMLQTYDKWEMIIVDDGSTDQTPQRIANFNDSRIRYIRQANEGIAGLHKTYNRALGEAKGDIVAILEGDDYWPNDKLKIQVQDFDNPEVVLSSGQTAVDLGDGSTPKIIPTQMPPEEARFNRPVGRAAKHMVSQASLTYTFPVSTVLRTETLRNIGGFQQPDYSLVVDFPTFLRMTIEGEFRFHERVLGFWRRHITSTTLSRMPEIMEGAYHYGFEFLQEHREQLPLTDDELDAIQNHWDEVNAMSCILRGRLLNREGYRVLAAKAFRESNLYRAKGKTKLFAAVAALLSSIKMPVEPIYKLAGRVPLDEAITLDTGDRIISMEDMNRARYVGRWRKTDITPSSQ